VFNQETCEWRNLIDLGRQDDPLEHFASSSSKRLRNTQVSPPAFAKRTQATPLSPPSPLPSSDRDERQQTLVGRIRIHRSQHQPAPQQRRQQPHLVAPRMKLMVAQDHTVNRCAAVAAARSTSHRPRHRTVTRPRPAAPDRATHMPKGAVRPSEGYGILRRHPSCILLGLVTSPS
jgi:hypothetical protein